MTSAAAPPTVMWFRRDLRRLAALARYQAAREAVMRHLRWTAPAVLGTALAGGLGTDVRSRWYAGLDKPPWQPPAGAFAPAWTTLYVLLAVASARTLDRAEDEKERRAYARALALNLGLNAAWSWVFFTAKQPWWAVAEILLLDVSTLDLLRRSARVDRSSAGMLLPYAAWVTFATALNASIASRNPGA